MGNILINNFGTLSSPTPAPPSARTVVLFGLPQQPAFVPRQSVKLPTSQHRAEGQRRSPAGLANHDEVRLPNAQPNSARCSCKRVNEHNRRRAAAFERAPRPEVEILLVEYFDDAHYLHLVDPGVGVEIFFEGLAETRASVRCGN